MNKSFTIIELMIAVFILMVGILSAFALVSSSLSYSSVYKLQLTAAYLAQEGIEIVRNIRDTNWLDPAKPAWDDGLTNCKSLENKFCEADYNDSELTSYNDSFAGNYLKTDGGFYSYTGTTDTLFKRKIKLDSSGDIITITVTIYWSERGRDHTFQAQEKIYNWR